MIIDKWTGIVYNEIRKGGRLMYSALDISKYIVTKCTNDSKAITNLQLQKILYYIQREYLKSDSRAFDDPIEAWKFGPVVREVYYYFCGYGAMPIVANYDFMPAPKDRGVIDSIVCAKRELDPWHLVEDTHKPDKAWALTFKDGDGDKRIIDIDLIRKKG